MKKVRRLLVAASVVPSPPIPVTLTKEAVSSFETSVLTRATWRNIQEDTILQCSVPTKAETKLTSNRRTLRRNTIACCLLLLSGIVRLLHVLEDGGCMYARNVGRLTPNRTDLFTRQQYY
jgi:hypothetical protein